MKMRIVSKDLLAVHLKESETVIVHTDQGCIHVTQNNLTTEVIYYDHFNIEILGAHKDRPKVTIDSDEYPTDIQVMNTYSSFNLEGERL